MQKDKEFILKAGSFVIKKSFWSLITFNSQAIETLKIKDAIITIKSDKIDKQSVKEEIINFLKLENFLKAEHSYNINIVNVINKKNIDNNLLICKVVGNGPIIYKNINGYLFMNIEYHINARGFLWKRIGNNKIIFGLTERKCGFHKKISDAVLNTDPTCIKNTTLYKSIGTIIGNDLVEYLVQVPNDDILDEIENKPTKIPSLFQLCIYSLSSKDLNTYNQLNQNFVLSFQ
jgi:hypothetical protein